MPASTIAKFFHVGLFHVYDTGHKDTAIGRDEPPRLENDLEFPFLEKRENLRRELFCRLGILVAVDRTQPAPQVQEFDLHAPAFKIVDKFENLPERLKKRIPSLDLGPDVHMNAADPSMAKFLAGFEDFFGFSKSMPNLVSALPVVM